MHNEYDVGRIEMYVYRLEYPLYINNSWAGIYRNGKIWDEKFLSPLYDSELDVGWLAGFQSTKQTRRPGPDEELDYKWKETALELWKDARMGTINIRFGFVSLKQLRTWFTRKILGCNMHPEMKWNISIYDLPDDYVFATETQCVFCLQKASLVGRIKL